MSLADPELALDVDLAITQRARAELRLALDDVLKESDDESGWSAFCTSLLLLLSD